MVLLAGTLTSPPSRRTRSSRILRAPSAASRPSAGQSGFQPAAAAGWRSAPDGVTDRSGPKARAPCSDRISCSQSSGISQNPGRRPSWLPRPTGGRQSEGALPSPNSLSTASTPPALKGEKCYPCVRYEVSPMSRAAQRSANCATLARKSLILHYGFSFPLYPRGRFGSPNAVHFRLHFFGDGRSLTSACGVGRVSVRHGRHGGPIGCSGSWTIRGWRRCSGVGRVREISCGHLSRCDTDKKCSKCTHDGLLKHGVSSVGSEGKNALCAPQVPVSR
jgi:hypothetical protein